MTEAEWLTCTDPERMLDFLSGKASPRKLRLFACAFCRLVWHLFSDKPTRKAIKIAERYADGLATDLDLRVASYAALQAECKAAQKNSSQENQALRSMAWEVSRAAIADNLNLPTSIRFAIYAFLDASPEEDLFRPCGLFLEIFGPLLFRPAAVDPTWLTWHDGLLASMAQHMYDSRDFSDMPILADALEEAGCTNPDILGHCRSGGEHVRGCWVIDALLGKQ